MALFKDRNAHSWMVLVLVASRMLVLFIFCVAVASASSSMPKIIYPNGDGPKGGSSRIINGDRADRVTSRHQVLLARQTGEDPGFYFMCGGSVLNDMWVITAAHCTDIFGTYMAVINEYELGEKVDPGEQAIYVNTIFNHPNYTRTPLLNDIAMLKLAWKIEGEYTPIQIQDEVDEPQGSHCVISGWGGPSSELQFSDILLQAHGRLMPNYECEFFWTYGLPDHTVCFYNGTTGACYGDSGGPMVCDTYKGRVLSGVMSAMDPECHPGMPSIYTRVSTFKDWIRDIMRFNHF